MDVSTKSCGERVATKPYHTSHPGYVLVPKKKMPAVSATPMPGHHRQSSRSQTFLRVVHPTATQKKWSVSQLDAQRPKRRIDYLAHRSTFKWHARAARSGQQARSFGFLRGTRCWSLRDRRHLSALLQMQWDCAACSAAWPRTATGDVTGPQRHDHNRMSTVTRLDDRCS